MPSVGHKALTWGTTGESFADLAAIVADVALDDAA